MKLEAVIFMPDNTTIRFKLKNPSSNFVLKYKVDNEELPFEYNFKRENIIIDRPFLIKKKTIFYKHNNPNPLSTDFVAEAIDVNQIKAFVDNQIFNDIARSTKDSKLQFSLGLVLGLAGILAIVLIAIFA